MDIGNHCAEPTCRQKDFLPFTCKYCEKLFCLDHKEPTSHNCEKSNFGDRKALVCPLCQTTLYYEVGQSSETEVWNKHNTMECRLRKNLKKNGENQQFCAAKACKTKLTSVNIFKCKNCGKEVCLKHRFEEDHECVKAPVPAPKVTKQAPARSINEQQKYEENQTVETKKKTKKKGFFGKIIRTITCSSNKKAKV